MSVIHWSDKKLLEVQRLYKNYENKSNITEALKDVTFDVLPGEFLGIMGQSNLVKRHY